MGKPGFLDSFFRKNGNENARREGQPEVTRQSYPYHSHREQLISTQGGPTGKIRGSHYMPSLHMGSIYALGICLRSGKISQLLGKLSEQYIISTFVQVAFRWVRCSISEFTRLA